MNVTCDRCNGVFTSGVSWPRDDGRRDTYDVCSNCCVLVKTIRDHPLQTNTARRMIDELQDIATREQKSSNEIIRLQVENIDLRKRIDELTSKLSEVRTHAEPTPAPNPTISHPSSGFSGFYPTSRQPGFNSGSPATSDPPAAPAGRFGVFGNPSPSQPVFNFGDSAHTVHKASQFSRSSHTGFGTSSDPRNGTPHQEVRFA